MSKKNSVSSVSNQRFPELKGFDYIEFYVGNAYQSAHFYRSALGFKVTAHAGLETGVRDRVSTLIEQNNIRLLLTAAQVPDNSIARHVNIHGDSVKDVAFLVDDVEKAFNRAVANGAKPLVEPIRLEDDYGYVLKGFSRNLDDEEWIFIQQFSV